MQEGMLGIITGFVIAGGAILIIMYTIRQLFKGDSGRNPRREPGAKKEIPPPIIPLRPRGAIPMPAQERNESTNGEKHTCVTFTHQAEGFQAIFTRNTPLGKKTLPLADKLRLREAELEIVGRKVFVIPADSSEIRLEGKLLKPEERTELPIGLRFIRINGEKYTVRVERIK